MKQELIRLGEEAERLREARSPKQLKTIHDFIDLARENPGQKIAVTKNDKPMIALTSNGKTVWLDSEYCSWNLKYYKDTSRKSI